MIKRLFVENFKSIKKTDVNLPSFTVLVGKNAVGKTNFLQAVGFIKDLVLGSTISVAASKIIEIEEELFNASDNVDSIHLGIEISEDEKESYLLEFKLKLLRVADSIPTVVIDEEILYSLHNNREVVFSRKDKVVKNSSGDRIPLAITSDKLVVSQYGDGVVARVKNLFANVTLLSFDKSILEDSFAKPGNENLARVLMRLQKRPEDYQKFLKMVQKMLPAFSNMVDFPMGDSQLNKSLKGAEERSYLLFIKEKGLQNMFSMKLASFGDLRTLYLIASLIDIKPNGSILFEELENGIHPHRLIEIIEYLENISIARSVQVIFTSHNPMVINRLPAQKILYFEKNSDQKKGTIIKLLSNPEDLSKVKKILQAGGEMTEYIQMLSE